MRKLEPGRLLIASHNPGKVREIADLLGPHGIEPVSAAELDLPEPDEIGTTFIDNADLKARAAADLSGLPALADDSGLEVDALGGAPGVISARYAGPEQDVRRNNDKLVAALARVPPQRRTARFRSVLALADTAGSLAERVLTAEGTCEGMILEAPRGTGGFGYDPLFFSPELGLSFAEAGIGP